MRASCRRAAVAGEPDARLGVLADAEPEVVGVDLRPGARRGKSHDQLAAADAEVACGVCDVVLMGPAVAVMPGPSVERIAVELVVEDQPPSATDTQRRAARQVGSGSAGGRHSDRGRDEGTENDKLDRSDGTRVLDHAKFGLLVHRGPGGAVGPWFGVTDRPREARVRVQRPPERRAADGSDVYRPLRSAALATDPVSRIYAGPPSKSVDELGRAPAALGLEWEGR